MQLKYHGGLTRSLYSSLRFSEIVLQVETNYEKMVDLSKDIPEMEITNYPDNLFLTLSVKTLKYENIFTLFRKRRCVVSQFHK